MTQNIRDIRQITQMAGGHKAVAEKLGLTVAMVRNQWPQHGIHHKHWATLMEMAEAEGKRLTPAHIYAANMLVAADNRASA